MTSKRNRIGVSGGTEFEPLSPEGGAAFFGSRLGLHRGSGVWVLDDMRSRFEVVTDAMGEHWVWTGVMAGNSTPMAHFHGDKVAARRLAWVLSGRPLMRSKKVVGTCGDPKCINPACSRAVSDTKAVVRNATQLGRHQTPKKRQALRALVAKQRALSRDQVRSILLDSRPAHVVANDHGVGRTTISAIRRRERYADVHVAAGDVFSLAQSGRYNRVVVG